MMSDEWRYAFNSVAGTSHIRRKLPCQDAGDCRVVTAANDEQVLIAIVSDGAGSSARADYAAQQACALFFENATRLFANGGSVRDATHDFFSVWVKAFQAAIAAQAKEEDLSIYEYACTAAAAIVGEQAAAFFQVGDGAIVVNGESDEYDWVFWPEKGEFANETSFLIGVGTFYTAQYEFVTGRIEELALFTDGLELLLLNMAGQTVHSPFFRMAFAPLRQSPSGHDEKLSQSLAVFLASDEVNDRTSDDKTLILATRAAHGNEAL